MPEKCLEGENEAVSPNPVMEPNRRAHPADRHRIRRCIDRREAKFFDKFSTKIFHIDFLGAYLQRFLFCSFKVL